MKVLHLGKYYPPFYGGMEKMNYDIVENMKGKYDCEQDVLCCSHSKDFQETMSTDYKLFRLPLRCVIASTPIPKGLFSLYKRIRNDYDIIYLHLPNPLLSLMILVYPTKAKIVAHWQGDIMRHQLLLWLYKPIQSLMLKRADRIVVTSENYAKFSQPLQPYQNKITVIPIGIDNKYLEADFSKVDEVKNKYKGKKIVLSIGRLTHYKGFKYLVEAAKHLDNNTVVLIAGIGELEQNLRNQIDRDNLSDRVKLIGRVPDGYMGAYLRAADVYCLPSITKAEGYGIVLLEAMSVGTPIVASNLTDSAAPWINQDSVTGYNVEKMNPQDIADGICKILDDNQKRTEFSKNCIDRYERMFTLDKMLEKVYQMYKELVRE